MKKVFSVFLCGVLLLSLFGCGQSEQDKLYDELTAKSSAVSSEPVPSEPESQPEESNEAEAEDEELDVMKRAHIRTLDWSDVFDLEPNTELSGTLKVRGFFRDAIEPWTEAFMAAYPNVTIELTITPIDSEAAAEAFAVALNSGTAGDVVMTGLISNIKSAKSGLYQDLYPFMEDDPDFIMEDYYTNIFEALETKDGKLCTVSPSFSTPCVFFNTGITDTVGVDLISDYPEGMSYKDVVDLYDRCVEAGVLEESTPLSPLGSKDYLSEMVLSDYLDEKNETSDFENPGYIEYLKTMMRIPAGVDIFWDGFVFDYDFKGTKDFMVIGSSSLDFLTYYREGDEKMSSSVLMPCKTEGGKRLFETTCAVAITSSCQNPELAWEFVKFMLSEKPFPEKPNEDGTYEAAYTEIYRYGMPVNRKNFENLCRACCQDEELIQYVGKVLEKYDTPRFSNSDLLFAWGNILRNYFQYELISPEECAKQLQERTWIYMNE